MTKKTFKRGAVWRISFVKVTPGRCDEYLMEVGPAREKVMQEAKKQGIVLDHKTLNGLAMGQQDWDLMFMVQYRNWAAIDEVHAQLEAIHEKATKRRETSGEEQGRTSIREIIGEKFMQEITF